MPYSEVTVSGYNANPPEDDGTQVASNEIEWQKHLDKIGDPLKTALEATQTNITTIIDEIEAKAASDTEAGFIEIATAAEMEAASSTTLAVTPGRAHRHPGVAKAWGSVSEPSTLRGAYNITSVSRISEGVYGITIANDLADANYSVDVTTTQAALRVGTAPNAFKAAGSFRVHIYRYDNSVNDELIDTDFDFVVYGDQ